jgi:FAD/FMN-containing dehydrogenase
MVCLAGILQSLPLIYMLAYGGGQPNTITIDLKNFQSFSMDPETHIASVGAGMKLGDVTKNLLEAGNRAIAHGTCPDVGIGGHATMGGLGPTSRMWGSAMDHVVEMEVVLADSKILTVNAEQYHEIFWAMKGAGASFAIVTQFKFRTHEAPGELVEYSYTFSPRPYSALADRFKKWQNLISNPTLSHKFASQVVISELGMIISGTYFGSEDEWDALNITGVFPERTSALDKILVLDDFAGAVTNWAENIALTIGGVIASAFTSKNIAFTKNDLIPSTTIDRFFKFLDTVNKNTPIWFCIFDLEGGAINEIPANATSYGHRDALFYVQTYAVNIGKVSDTTRKFVQGMDDIFRSGFPDRTLGSYAGYVDPSLKNAQEMYFGGNLPELTRIKRIIDPRDVFSNPQSVRP